MNVESATEIRWQAASAWARQQGQGQGQTIQHRTIQSGRFRREATFLYKGVYGNFDGIPNLKKREYGVKGADGGIDASSENMIHYSSKNKSKG